MSEESKPARTREELTSTYMHTLARIGEKFYHISKVKAEIQAMFTEVDQLQLEASKLAQEPKQEEQPQEAVAQETKE